MVTCAVRKCKNNSAKISKNKDGITFHRFPKDKDRRDRWEMAVNRDNMWASTSSSAVCSEHFETRDFYLTESGLRRLQGEAVPSINICPFEDEQPTISVLKPIYINADDSKEVIELKHKVRRLEVISDNRKKRLNLMWQSKRRMKMKLDKLKRIIKHLVQSKKCMKDLGSHVSKLSVK